MGFYLSKDVSKKENGRPGKATVDKSGSNKAPLDSFNKDVPEQEQIEIRQIKHPNNIAEQDHRFIKKRTCPTLALKALICEGNDLRD